jgi:hypothetical protein
MFFLHFSYLQAIWRDYQLQHVYNAAQKRMVDTGTDFCVYYGCAYLKPEVRGLDFHKKLSPLLSEAFLSQNGTGIDILTINKLVNHSKFAVGQGGFVADHVPYADQKLSVDGIPVFGKLTKLGGIYMVCTGPGDDI